MGGAIARWCGWFGSGSLGEEKAAENGIEAAFISAFCNLSRSYRISVGIADKIDNEVANHC